jgi:microcystin-dependent protein
MAILTPADTFDNVYKLETTDPVKAGTVAGPIDAPTDGQTNAPLQALANRTQYLYNRLLPVGSVLPYVGETAPTGFLVCNGASINRTTYAELFDVCGTNFGTVNSTSFNLPDLRGAFVRGWDNGAGIDPDAASRTATSLGGATGDNIGTEQDGALEAHTHTIPTSVGLIGSLVAEENSNQQVGSNLDTGSTGGSETRPFNISMNYIIKALP